MGKILICDSNENNLFSFRKSLILKLLEKNEIYISVPYTKRAEFFEKQGCILINTKIDRRGKNPFTDLKLLMKYRNLIRTIRPSLIISFSTKPNIYAGIACGKKTPFISTVTGLGEAIKEKTSFSGKITKFLYKIGLKNSSCVFVQNETILNYLKVNSMIKENYCMVNGSGVDLAQHLFEPYPDQGFPIKLLYIGRIMKIKGAIELINADKILTNNNISCEISILGTFESDFKDEFLANFENCNIKLLGFQENVHDYIKQCNAVVHPSYSEGMSNVLLEASATGRPVLASNIPGCRETFDEGITGFGFEPKSVDSLVTTIIKFVNLPYETKVEMGRLARIKVMNQFDRNKIVDIYINKIESLN